MSSDDEPIHGFHRDGRPGEHRYQERGRRGRRGGGSSRSRSRAARSRDSSAPYHLRRRGSRSADSLDDPSFEWDGMLENNQRRLRQDSYVNRIGSNSSRPPPSPGGQNYRIYMASPTVGDNARNRDQRQAGAGATAPPERGAVAADIDPIVARHKTKLVSLAPVLECLEPPGTASLMV